MVGVDASRGRLATLASTIRYALAPFGPRAATLATLAEFAVERRH